MPNNKVGNCSGCDCQPKLEYSHLTHEPYYSCPVCGCSVNPCSTVSKAILAWNKKQQYLGQAV